MRAIALKNIEIMKREGIVEHVRDTQDVFRAKLETLLDVPIVGDVRGTGFFYAIEPRATARRRRRSTTTNASHSCAASLAGVVRGGPDLPSGRSR